MCVYVCTDTTVGSVHARDLLDVATLTNAHVQDDWCASTVVAVRVQPLDDIVTQRFQDAPNLVVLSAKASYTLDLTDCGRKFKWPLTFVNKERVNKERGGPTLLDTRDFYLTLGTFCGQMSTLFARAQNPFKTRQGVATRRYKH